MKKMLLIPISCLVISTGLFATTDSFDVSSSIKSCMGCHGQTFQKKALGHSDVVNLMKLEDIKTALRNYKNNPPDDSMATIMKSQVRKYNNEQLDLIAKKVFTFSKLKKEN